MGETVEIDVGTLYTGQAKLSELPAYMERTLALAGDGNEVVLTGQGPIWLYLKLAHALHGKTRRLIYKSPAAGKVTVFDHDPF